MNPRELNAEFVAQALRQAGLGFSDHHKTYAAHRLEAGAVKYGEHQWQEADDAAEAAEEGIDGANWTAFEWIKRLESDTLDRSCEHLMQAAVCFAHAYEHLRLYMIERPDEPRP